MGIRQTLDKRFPTPSLVAILVLIALITAAVMSGYEFLKQFLFPEITIWKSHAITIIFTTFLVTLAAYFVGHKFAALNTRLRTLVSDRTEELERLEESQARKSSILQSALDCIISIDHQGKILEFNPAAEKTFGFARDNVLGKELAETIVPPSLRAAHRNGLTRYLENGTTHVLGQRIETTGLRADGTEFPIELAITRIDLPGPPTFMAHLRDNTERRRLEDQLRQSQKMEAVGQLAGGIAHDFNNLLTVIEGYGGLLQERMGKRGHALPEVDQIRIAAERAATLTSQLLAFSRQQVMESKVLDLNEIVTSLSRMLKPVLGEKIEFRLHLEPRLGHVKTDRGQIEQVIMNLAINARDAMAGGGKLTIESNNVLLDEQYASNTNGAKPGNHVMLAVSDTGHGMTAKVISQIFEPFFTTKQKGHGTGLGLSTVYGIVKQSGGHVNVYSEVGVGTTFKVYLPRVDDPIEEGLARGPSTSVKGNESILVVEDEQAVGLLVKFQLESQGYNVMMASTGPEAMNICGQPAPIDLLISDVVLSEMNGRELAQRITGLRPEIKVLFMSGYTNDAVLQHGILDIGAAFLQKPFTSDSLRNKVREVLDAAPIKQYDWNAFQDRLDKR